MHFIDVVHGMLFLLNSSNIFKEHVVGWVQNTQHKLRFNTLNCETYCRGMLWKHLVFMGSEKWHIAALDAKTSLEPKKSIWTATCWNQVKRIWKSNSCICAVVLYFTEHLLLPLAGSPALVSTKTSRPLNHSCPLWPLSHTYFGWKARPSANETLWSKRTFWPLTIYDHGSDSTRV